MGFHLKSAMKNFLKKNCEYFILGIIVLLFAALSIFGVGNMSAPSSFYQTGELEDSQYYNSLCYEIDYSEKAYTLDSVWVNFGSPDYKKDYSQDTIERVKFYTSMANTTAGSFYETTCFPGADTTDDEYESGVVRNTVAEFMVGAWQVMCENISTNQYPYFLISTKNSIKINEIVFVGVDTNGVKVVLPVKSYGAGEKIAYQGSASPLDKSSEFGVDLLAVAYANRLIDEQDKFDLSLISENNVYNGGKVVFTQTEAYTLESVRNLNTGRGNFVDKTSMPLGQYILSIGTSIFGYTTLGLRIMPMLFGIAIVILFFFMGKLIFGKSLYALILSGLAVASGLLLSLSTIGSVEVIASFFVLLSFTLTLKFYKKGISNKHFTLDIISLLIAGLSFAVAFATKVTSIYYLIPIALVFVFGMIRQNKAYKIRLANEEDAKKQAGITAVYQRKATLSAVVAFMSFVIATLLISVVCFLIGYGTYSSVYGQTNAISYTFSVIKDGFSSINATTFDSISTYNFFGYAVNYGAQAFGGSKFAFGNIILTFIGVFALVYCFIYYIFDLFDKNKNEKHYKGVYVNYLFLAVSYIVGFVLMGIISNVGISGYLTPSLFSLVIIVCAFYIFDNEDKKAIFKVNKTEFSITRTVATILAVAAIVAFALSIPALLGITVNPNLFSWNLLTYNVI